MKTNWHVGTAAEAFAAGQFARFGWDISVQYGANQPEYDLVAVKGDLMLKVSVKGSNNGELGLSQSFLEKREKQFDDAGKPIKQPPPDYHNAINLWLAGHGRLTVFLLVQFYKIPVSEMPRIYIATPMEIAARLKNTARGRGDTILYEEKKWASNAHGAGTVELIPEAWLFSPERLGRIARELGGISASISLGV